jgi:hypothetical protein
MKNMSSRIQNGEIWKIVSSNSANPVDNGGRELSRLLGYLLTDGYISQRAKSNWSIGIVNQNKAILKDFKMLMKKLFGVKKFKNKNAPDGTPEVYVNSKKICTSILKLITSARTRACSHHPICPLLKGKSHKSCLICKPIKIEDGIFPPARYPEFIMKNKELAREVLIAAFSCDGGVTIYKHNGKLKGKVFLSCTNPILRSQYLEMLKLLGIKCIENGPQIEINSIKSLILFRDRIGFLKGVVSSTHSKKFSHISKNKLLNYVISTSISG